MENPVNKLRLSLGFYCFSCGSSAGFCYLFSDQRKMIGEVNCYSISVSLAGSCHCCLLGWVLLPASRPMQDNRGRWTAVSLAGSLLPAFRPMQDNGGDELLLNCFLLGWVLLPAFRPRRIMGEMNCYSISFSLAGSCYLLSDLCRINRKRWIVTQLSSLRLSPPVFTMAF